MANAPDMASVGSTGSERRITNVAPGLADTDAVNMDQLNASLAGIDGRIDDLEKDAFSGSGTE